MARAWSHSKWSCLFPLSCKGLSKQSAKLLLKSDLQIGARPWNSVFAKVTEEGVNRVCKSTQISWVPMRLHTARWGKPVRPSCAVLLLFFAIKVPFNLALTFSKHLSPATDRFWANCCAEKLPFWKHLKTAVIKLTWQGVSIACSRCTKVCFLWLSYWWDLVTHQKTAWKKRLILNRVWLRSEWWSWDSGSELEIAVGWGREDRQLSASHWCELLLSQ